MLQTKIVGTAEMVKKKKDLWHKAIFNKIASLFAEKGALKLLTKEDSDRYVKEKGAVPLPSKTIFTHGQARSGEPSGQTQMPTRGMRQL